MTLDELVAELRTRFGEAIEILERSDDHLALRVGGNEDAILGVRLADPARPSFNVSYPELKIKRDGSRRVEVAEFDGALIEAVRWIVDELQRNGFVTPEFV